VILNTCILFWTKRSIPNYLWSGFCQYPNSRKNYLTETEKREIFSKNFLKFFTLIDYPVKITPENAGEASDKVGNRALPGGKSGQK